MQIPTYAQLKKALHLSETIETLQKEMASIFGEKIPAAAKSAGSTILDLVGLGGKKKRKMSASHRAAIVKAQKLRWSKVKKGKETGGKAKAKKKGKMSAAGRAAIVKAQKLRWAKFKKAKTVKPKAQKRGRKASPVAPVPQAAV